MKKRSSSEKSQKRTAKTKRTQERVTIGMDLGDKTSRYCMLSNEGEILREGQVTTTKAGMVEAFGSLGRARIAIEVGTHSPWVSRLLRNLGHEMNRGQSKAGEADHGEQPQRRSIGRSNVGPTGAN